MEILNNPKANNSFTLRCSLKDNVGGNITIPANKDTLLNNVSTVGQGKAWVYLSNKSATPTYAITNDGTTDIPLQGVYCFAESDNGNVMYFTVRGGLPAGVYECLLEYQLKNGSGQWNQRLSSQTIQISVDPQKIDITV